jgi:hypothetical protein
MEYKRKIMPNNNPNLYAVVPGKFVCEVADEEHVNKLHLIPVIAWRLAWNPDEDNEVTHYPFIEPITASTGEALATFGGQDAIIYDKATEIWTRGSNGELFLGYGLKSLQDYYDVEIKNNLD